MALPIEEIKKLIIESIPDATIEIKDLMGDNNHYAAKIKSSQLLMFFRTFKLVNSFPIILS